MVDASFALWGESALFTSFIIGCVQALGGPFVIRRFPLHSLTLMRASALFQVVLVTLAFLSLIHAYVMGDFSLKNVFENSHSDTPLLYKITGVWGNHEGSMLLWMWLFSLYAGAFSITRSAALEKQARSKALWIHGVIYLMSLGYVVFLSSPFTRLSGRSSQGMELNPLLKDLSLAFHPPLLYAGYLGFGLVFALSLVASLKKQARSWCLWSWSCLTLGIALGSFWAYYELGWGGWWFWDPVENASLMPWLCATALLHVMMTKSHKTASVLGVMTFAFCLLGLCLVRSGVLSTVHAFASDPGRGAYLGAQAFLVTFWGLVTVLRRPSSDAPSTLGINQLTVIQLQLILFMTLLFTVVVATLYPLALETLTGVSITVGAPYFDKTFVPLSFLTLMLMGGAVLLPRATPLGWREIKKRVATPLLVSLLLTCVLLYVWDPWLWRTFMGMVLVFWIIVTTLTRLCKGPLTLRDIGMALAHLGVAALIFGICVQIREGRETLLALKEGESATFAGSTLTLESVDGYRAPTYMGEKARIKLVPSGQILTPEKRFYPFREILTSETSLVKRGMSITYAALGGLLPGNRWGLRLYDHPQVIWIWVSAIMMALGGILCLAFSRKQRGGP